MNIFKNSPMLKRGSKTTHPERYAPNGEPLIWYPGNSWQARLAAWRAHSKENANAAAEAPVPEAHEAHAVEAADEIPSSRTQPREVEYEWPTPIDARSRAEEDERLPF